MGRKYHVVLPKDKIAEFCKRHHIRKLSLFGSCLHGYFGPESDMDLLVEFEPKHIPGLITLSGREIELSEIIGRKVDLRAHEDLSCYFRKEVIKSAEVQCVQERRLRRNHDANNQIRNKHDS